jgi:MarR family transcriptional regulator, lower aerobic nicotinate degradation pathway regulator
VPLGDDHPVLTPLPGEGGLGLVDGLAQLTFAVQGALGRVAATHDLSIVQARLLGILRDRTPTINELARFLQLDKSSVTGLVDRAQERGLVQRTASALDRRSVQVSVTAAGEELIERATAAVEVEIAALVADLGPTQRHRLSTIASLIVATDARRRGIDLLVEPGAPGAEREAGGTVSRPAGHISGPRGN